MSAREQARNLFIGVMTAHMREVIELLVAAVPEAQRSQELLQDMRETPARVARMYADDLLTGYAADVGKILATSFEDKYDGVVLERDIPFTSLCRHHLLPFTGVAHVAYIPVGKVVGLSKLARVVDCYARRLQLQEHLGDEVVEALVTHLNPLGAACILRAEHLCMTCRGVRKPGAVTVTSSLRGVYRTDVAARAELMALVGHV